MVLGPTPVSVVEQYSSLTGKPFLVPYWSLGYHQCRFGYNSLNKTRAILEQTIDAGIPIDVQWNDIDYMDQVWSLVPIEVCSLFNVTIIQQWAF